MSVPDRSSHGRLSAGSRMLHNKNAFHGSSSPVKRRPCIVNGSPTGRKCLSKVSNAHGPTSWGLIKAFRRSLIVGHPFQSVIVGGTNNTFMSYYLLVVAVHWQQSLPLPLAMSCRRSLCALRSEVTLRVVFTTLVAVSEPAARLVVCPPPGTSESLRGTFSAPLLSLSSASTALRCATGTLELYF